MCQKSPDGVSNSTGIRNPSGDPCGWRTTRPAFRSCESLCSTSRRVSAGRLRAAQSIAPWLLTPTVLPGMLSPFPPRSTWITTGTRSITRWLRRRSSIATPLEVLAGPDLAEDFDGVKVRGPKNPFQARSIQYRIPSLPRVHGLSRR